VIPPPDLATAMMRDRQAAQCARAAGETARAYVASSFDLRELTLYGGERMIVAVATDFCMTLGQSTRIMIFDATRGYRRVLDGVTLPDAFDVNADGSVVLPTHETMETIFEGAYVWNGRAYAFSAQRSHLYDVPLGQRRPYQVRVHFPAGSSSTTLRGTTALNFGERYVFEARAGERVTLQLMEHGGPRPSMSLWSADGNVTIAASIGERWSGKVSRTGTYSLSIIGAGDADPDRISTYAVELRLGPANGE
jgi:hypothetical protein